MLTLALGNHVHSPIDRLHQHCSPSCSSLNIRSFPFPEASPPYKTSRISWNSVLRIHKAKARCSLADGAQEVQEEDFQVITAIRSDFNDIMVVDTPKSRMLLLDSTHNVHSMFIKGQKWTGSYWDEFASLPPIVPKGPIALFGLGGGTAAHLMLDLWPSLQLEGWEIDEILIDKAREYLGLSDLEKRTQLGGILNVHVGDALSPSVDVSGGYAGIVIDLFTEGKVLLQLQKVSTWLELNDKLMANGRIMVNCGAANDTASDSPDRILCPENPSIDDTWVQNSTIKAMSAAFPGQLCWKRMPEREGKNYLALTGPLPNLNSWSSMVPDRLSSSVKQWRPCETFRKNISLSLVIITTF